MHTKANVQAFNGDVLGNGSYRYSNSSVDIAKSFSNSRSTRAILEAGRLSGKSVIDIGCGDGTFSFELAAAGAKTVTGIDPADQAISSASRKAHELGLTNIDFRCFNVYDLTESFGRFDIAIVRGVLHHLAMPDEALKAIASVCDEIVVLEPNGCNPVLKLIERFSRYHIEHEERSFFPWTVDRWLRDAGKRPVTKEVLNFVPLFCPPWLAKILKSVEPIVECLPIVRLIGCGQYVVKAR